MNKLTSKQSQAIYDAMKTPAYKAQRKLCRVANSQNASKAEKAICIAARINQRQIDAMKK